MKKKSSPTPASKSPAGNLPVSKQTAGGVAGAIVGSAIAGPLGAVAGAIAGTLMGNRAAEGKTLVSSNAVKKAKGVVASVKKKLPAKAVRAVGKAVDATRKLAKSVQSKKGAAKTSGKKATAKSTGAGKSAGAAKAKGTAKKTSAAKPKAAKKRK